MSIAIDPNRPTAKEIAAHNMKVSKANLASGIATALASNSGFFSSGIVTAEDLAMYAITVAETIIEKYTLMIDGAGNQGGIV